MVVSWQYGDWLFPECPPPMRNPTVFAQILAGVDHQELARAAARFPMPRVSRSLSPYDHFAAQLRQAGIGLVLQALLRRPVTLDRGPHRAHLVRPQHHDPAPAPLGVAEDGRLVEGLPETTVAVRLATTALLDYHRPPYEPGRLLGCYGHTLPDLQSAYYS